MRIEDYWHDINIYEVVYKCNSESNKNLDYGYICCENSTEEYELGKIVEKKIGNECSDNTCITINEVFSGLIDKKIDKNMKKFNCYEVTFEVNFRNDNKLINKIILDDPNKSYDEICSKVKQQFQDVIKVLRISTLASVNSVDW